MAIENDQIDTTSTPADIRVEPVKEPVVDYRDLLAKTRTEAASHRVAAREAKEAADKAAEEAVQRAQEAEAARAEASAAKRELDLLKIQTEFGLTDAQAARLKGSNADELREDAKALAEAFGIGEGDGRPGVPRSPKPVMRHGGLEVDDELDVDGMTPAQLARLVMGDRGRFF